MNLKEFARKLGLSQTTVSRALNGYPEVSEHTRRRVVEMADTWNYRPNARARSLATGRAMAVGHIIPMSAQGELLNPVFGDFLAGASETYAANGYDLTLSLVRDEDEPNTYHQLATTGSVDGIIVHAPRIEDPRPALLRDVGLPFVVHGRSLNGTDGYSWLDINNRRGFDRATRHLLDLGHSRIALLNGDETQAFAYRRRQGYESALAAAGLCVDPGLMRSSEMTESYGYGAARDMLDGPDAPTAFLTSSLVTAFGVRRAVEQAGLRLGRDVSLITHDDDLGYFRSDDTEPEFTSLRSSVRAAGRRSAELLLSLVRDPEAGPLQELFEVDFLLGRSTGPALN